MAVCRSASGGTMKTRKSATTANGKAPARGTQKKMKDKKPSCFGNFGTCLKKNACPWRLECYLEYYLHGK